jgi:hypothetical protein
MQANSAPLSNVIEIRSPYRTGGALTIAQERGGSLLLDEQGSLLVRLPLDGTERRRSEMDMGGMMVLLEEVIPAKLSTIIGYAAAAIEQIDPTQRITDVAVAARISGAEYCAWRTQAQHAEALARSRSATLERRARTLRRSGPGYQPLLMCPGDQRGPTTAEFSTKFPIFELHCSKPGIDELPVVEVGVHDQ